MKDKINKNNPDDKVFAMILDSIGNDAETRVTSSVFDSKEAPWPEETEEGKLSVDVVQVDDSIIVIAPVAGAVSEKVEVFIHNDLLTIKGARSIPLDITKEIDYYYQECFWGKFSRTIVLPVEVKGDLAQAEYKNGVLRIMIPKRKIDAKVPIKIVEE